MRRSPRSISRTGSRSATSSDDRQAGIQYWRIRAPIGVPGPTRVSSSFSACEVILSSSRCGRALQHPIAAVAVQDRRRHQATAAVSSLTSSALSSPA